MGRPQATVDIQQQPIDVGFSGIDIARWAAAEDPDLFGHTAGQLVQLQPLPAADLLVQLAVDDHLQRLALARLGGPRQDDPSGNLQAGPIGPQPQAELQLVDHPRLSRIVGQVDLRTAASGQADRFGPLATVDLLADPLMPQDPVGRIAAVPFPAGQGTLQAVPAGGLSRQGRWIKADRDGQTDQQHVPELAQHGQMAASITIGVAIPGQRVASGHHHLIAKVALAA